MTLQAHSHGDPDHQDHAGHGHAHAIPGPAPLRAGEAQRLWLTLALALLATALEAVGGTLANSLALLSDAGHMLTDAGAVALSLFALKVSQRPADARRTYGWYRLEILAALVNGALLLAISFGIGWEAVQRLRAPQHVALTTVLFVAGIGILLNLTGMWLTHVKGPHGSMNLRSTFLHLAGDLLNSVGVMASALLIRVTGWLAWDPIISFFIAFTIVVSALRLCREAVDVLLENFPRHLDPCEVGEALRELKGVAAVHDLHVWTITSGLISLSAHLVVTCQGPDCRSHDEILDDLKGVLKSRFAIEHSTIQFEGQTFKHNELVH